MAQGLKVVAGGMMGAFIVAGLAFVAPKLGPTQTFILYFFVIAVVSALIDSFGLLGTEAKPLQARQLSACCSPVLGSCSPAPEGRAPDSGAPVPRKRPPIDLAEESAFAGPRDTLYLTLLICLGIL